MPKNIQAKHEKKTVPARGLREGRIGRTLAAANNGIEKTPTRRAYRKAQTHVGDEVYIDSYQHAELVS